MPWLFKIFELLSIMRYRWNKTVSLVLRWVIMFKIIFLVFNGGLLVVSYSRDVLSKAWLLVYSLIFYFIGKVSIDKFYRAHLCCMREFLVIKSWMIRGSFFPKFGSPEPIIYLLSFAHLLTRIIYSNAKTSWRIQLINFRQRLLHLFDQIRVVSPVPIILLQ